MTILGRHIFRQFMSLVTMILIGILVVYLCVEFLQKADRLIEFKATPTQVGLFFLYSIPSMLTMSLPIATLIGSVLSLGSLSRNNEIIAMRASGVSLMRIVTPLIFGGILISIIGFINNEYIMPEYTSRADYIRNVEIEKKQQRVMFQQSKLWLRGPDNSIANIELVAPNRHEMLGLNIYKLTPDFKVRERTKAASLVWKDDNWRLKNSITYTPEGDGMRARSSDGEIFNIVDSPDDLGMIVKDAREMNYQEMQDYVKRLKTSGYKAAQYEVDLYTKLAFPLSSLLMVMIAVPFSIHKVRGGGAAKGFAFSIVIAFFYWLLASMGASLGHSGVIPPLAAAWLPNGLFALTSIVVLGKMQTTM